jgi:hypothetical protein
MQVAALVEETDGMMMTRLRFLGTLSLAREEQGQYSRRLHHRRPIRLLAAPGSLARVRTRYLLLSARRHAQEREECHS